MKDIFREVSVARFLDTGMMESSFIEILRFLERFSCQVS